MYGKPMQLIIKGLQHFSKFESHNNV